MDTAPRLPQALRAALVRLAVESDTAGHALALVVILAGESMECIESVADDGSWSRSTAHFALATLDAMRP